VSIVLGPVVRALLVAIWPAGQNRSCGGQNFRDNFVNVCIGCAVIYDARPQAKV